VSAQSGLTLWVPVKESLPAEMQWVIVWDLSLGLARVGFYELGSWSCVEGGKLSVSHWHRFPAPPAGLEKSGGVR